MTEKTYASFIGLGPGLVNDKICFTTHEIKLTFCAMTKNALRIG